MDRDELIGASLGSYRVASKLGQGGMGAVYLAEHPVLGRKAAIKVLLPELSRQKDSVERFFHEARTTAQLRHPAMVDVFDYGTLPDGRAFLIMDYLEGEPLDARLRNQGAMIPAEALRVARQIALGVSVAHAEGIVHRDLKPDNIFLLPPVAGSNDERVKILDFGIAKLSRKTGGSSVTREGIVIGTPTYMSPEQCRGDAEVDPRADIYSLGCILFTMLAGRPPFESESMLELMWLHQNEQPPTLTSLDVSASAEVEEMVATMMAKVPDRRFASMIAAANAIKALLEGQGERLSTPTSRPRATLSTKSGLRASRTTPAFPVTRSPTPTAAVRPFSRAVVFGGGAALLVAALGIFLVGRSRQTQIVGPTPGPIPPPAVERTAGAPAVPPARVEPPPSAPAAVPAPTALPVIPPVAPAETPAELPRAGAPGRPNRRLRAAVTPGAQVPATKVPAPPTDGTPVPPGADRPPGKPIYRGTQLEIEKKAPY